MAANVHSLEAIEAVRAALVSFRDELEQAISAVDLEMRRVLDWLEHDRPRFWRTQLRKANDGVTEARAALHRCLMYPIADERPACYEERAELKKAEARLSYCTEKSERLRHWIREVRHEMFEYEGRISQLKDVAEIDTPRAMAILDRLLVRLQEYQALRTNSDRHVQLASDESLAIELMPEPAARNTTALNSTTAPTRDEQAEEPS